ncbi:SDR family oxidoreductase [Methanococcoides sp. SA1]|nr:SDR family oxidoreductase [Methanococcoides sp. SA1]
MKILVIGGSGLLGSNLIIKSSQKKEVQNEIIATYNENPMEIDECRWVKLDLRDKDGIFSLFDELKPDVVVHAAGLTNVDFCESNKEVAWDINVESTKSILDACRIYDTKIVYVSTDAVFDGVKDCRYVEEDVPNPLNYYGVTKFESEKLVRASGISYIIARTILMYGWKYEHQRPNPVTWMVGALRNNEMIKVVTDQYRNPILAANCADIIMELVNKGSEGLFHIAGGDCLSRYDFALEIASVFGLDASLIEPVTTDYFGEMTSRSMRTCYNVDKVENETNIKCMTAREGLALMKYLENMEV